MNTYFYNTENSPSTTNLVGMINSSVFPPEGTLVRLAKGLFKVEHVELWPEEKSIIVFVSKK